MTARFSLGPPEFAIIWAGDELTVTMTGPPCPEHIFVNGEPLMTFPEPLRSAVALECARYVVRRHALWCGELAYRRMRRVPLARGDAA
jgi:hypothetical protein